jgi:hypothetical protein
MDKLKTILIVFLLSIITLSSKSAHAQYVSKDYKDSVKKTICLNKSNTVIEAYYGYPYMGGLVLKASLDSFNVHITNYNHVGLRFEYLLMKDFGIGLEYTYALVSVKYQQNTSVYTASMSKQRFLGKVYFHFLEDANTDGYVTGGLGSSLTRITTNDPQNKVNENVTLFPLSIRAGIGFRHFFNETFGINGEAGIGGPLIQAGISIKL